MPPFSTRTSWDLAESSYAAAIRICNPRYDLTISNPTRCGLSYTPDLLAPLLDRRAEAYDPNPLGLLSAREAVALYYADHCAPVDPAQILLTASTSESYSYLFRLLCDAGDEVLVPQPSYPLFDFLAALDDVRLRPYPIFYDHGWHIDLSELERAISPRTRALLAVHPNNPTGHWTSAAERLQLEIVCARHNLALIVDEVFLDYPLLESPLEADGAQLRRSHTFAAGPHPVLTFVLSGLSKIAALPQMKAAWLLTLGPETARGHALSRLEVIADTFLSIGTPIQLAIPAWLAGRHGIQAQILARVRASLGFLIRFSADRPDRLDLLETSAGWSAVLSLPGCVGEPDCAERLIRERGVAVHPGSFYAMADSSRFVISLLTPPEILAEGIQLATN